jgi:hypothetical protein
MKEHQLCNYCQKTGEGIVEHYLSTRHSLNAKLEMATKEMSEIYDELECRDKKPVVICMPMLDIVERIYKKKVD